MLIGKATKSIQAGKTHRYWIGLGLIFLFLATDEAAHIHEHFGSDFLWGNYNSSGYLAWPWVIAYGSLVTIFVTRYFSFWWRLPHSFRKSFFIAGCLYVGSALGFEMLEAMEYSTNNSTYTFKYLVSKISLSLGNIVSTNICVQIGVRDDIPII